MRRKRSPHNCMKFFLKSHLYFSCPNILRFDNAKNWGNTICRCINVGMNSRIDFTPFYLLARLRLVSRYLRTSIQITLEIYDAIPPSLMTPLGLKKTIKLILLLLRINKVQILWESYKVWKNIFFKLHSNSKTKRGFFFKFLWPFQNIVTI